MLNSDWDRVKNQKITLLQFKSMPLTGMFVPSKGFIQTALCTVFSEISMGIFLYIIK